jgi:DNA-directed RNA polymerase subunit L
MKKTTIGLLLIITCINVYAQDFFIVKEDTTFCNNLKFSITSQGYLKSMSYDELTGKSVSIEGRKKVPAVLTFCIKGVLIDKTPLKAHKPDGYIRYTERAVDGKLKVYIGRQESVNLGNGNVPSGTYRFFIKMPDGTYYKINKKSNVEKYIKPYLLKCEEFKNQYKGDFSRREFQFMEMIKLYNSLCN